MRIVVGETFGSPEQYRLVERPSPSPRPGEARVDIHAAGLGHADVLAAAGGHQRKPPLPFTPGSEFSGVVEAIGTGDTRLAIGDRVTGVTASGALAEQIVVPVAALRLIPAPLDFAAAAAFRVDYLTALHALAGRAGLATGERLLVLGAAGGVGRAAVQIGKALGAYVIAGASTDARCTFARGQGADLAIDYSQPGWRDTLRATFDSVDVVFDPVGGALFQPAFRSLAWKGRYLVVGFAAGAIPQLPANLALVKGAALVGVEVGRFSQIEPEAAARDNDRIDGWIATGAIQPVIGAIFALNDFAAAMRTASRGDVTGKIVVCTRL